MHVVILDDDVSVRRALARLLKTEGMVVTATATSDQLFDALTQETPDCLILDLQMPGGMSGLDVLKRLEQLGVRIPTIILTAHGAAGTREACLNAGAAEFLRKPVDADLLIETIQNICGKPSRDTFRPFT